MILNIRFGDFMAQNTPCCVHCGTSVGSCATSIGLLESRLVGQIAAAPRRKLTSTGLNIGG